MNSRVLALVLAGVMGTSCADDGSQAPGQELTGDYLPPITIGNVLHNLEIAIGNRDVVEYSSLLSSGYIYVFSPPAPDSGFIWSREEDIRHLMDAYSKVPNGFRLQHLDFKFGPLHQDLPNIDPQLTTVILPAVTVSWESRHSTTGETLGFESLPSYGMTLTLSHNSEGVWTIEVWEDHPPAGSGCATWGDFKQRCGQDGGRPEGV